MPESQVAQVVRRFKSLLLDREAASMWQMAVRWRMVERTIEGHIDALATEIAQRQAEGEKVTPWHVQRMERYHRLQAQVRDELRRFQADAEAQIIANQRDYAELGIEAAYEAIRVGKAGVSFDRLPVSAVETMTGLAGDGSPLFSVLQKRAVTPEAVAGLTDSLVDAIAMGWNPRKTAVAMKDGLAQGLNKALVIARTEQLRSYRMANVAQFRESGVVRGFRRLVTKDARTCLACLMSDGETFALAEELTDHPNGRCVAVPVLAGEERPDWLQGRDWFESLPEDMQRQMMGDAKYESWQRDGWDLSALRKTAHSDVWGDSPRVATLEELQTA